MGGGGRVKVALFIYLMLFSLLKVSWFQKTSWNPPFFQKLNKKNRPNYYGNSGRIVFVCFFEEFKILKRHFEINWPLVKTFEFLAQSSVLTKAKQISNFLPNNEINIHCKYIWSNYDGITIYHRTSTIFRCNVPLFLNIPITKIRYPNFYSDMIVECQ